MAPTSTESLGDPRTFDALEQRAQETALKARLGAALVFLPLTWLQTRWGDFDLATFTLPLALFAGATSVAFALRRHPSAHRAAPFLPLGDVWLVATLLHRGLSVSPSPQATATQGLGVLAMVVVLGSFSAGLSGTVVATAASALALLWLMREAGVSADVQLTSQVVLLLLAAVSQAALQRLRASARALARAEASLKEEVDRAHALAQAKATIERLLVEANVQNGQLLGLQTEKELVTQMLVHDLRSPLGSVRSTLEWLREEFPKDADPELADAMRMSREALDRALAMIHDLLDISRLEAHALKLKAQPVELAQLLEVVQRALAPQAHTRGIRLTVSAPPQLPASVDRALLTRTLENLVSNALRYTPRGERIELTAREERGDLVLTVSNDGEPISERVRARIFEKFEQGEGDHRRAGWGLGLYFCGLVAQAHGGTIAVEPQAGWATSFVLRLPVAQLEVRAAA